MTCMDAKNCRCNPKLFYIHTSTAPADPPANFRASVVNSTVVLLSWSEPLIPYGKIVSYTLTYNASTPVTVASNDNSYLVAGLEEYTLYEFEVFASTRVGAGPSAVTVTTTSESCKNIV